MAVAALLGRAACRIALDDVQLGAGGIALRAVGQLAGQGQAFQRGLADDQVAGLAGGVARAGRGEALLDDGLGGGGVLLQEVVEGLADHLGHQGLHLGVHQLDLGLTFELRVGVLDADDGGHALAGVVTREVGVAVLEQAVAAGVVVDHPGDRRAQAGHVRTAVYRVDGVGEGVDRFGVGVGVLDGDLDADVVDFLLGVEDRVQHGAVVVQIAHEGHHPAVEIEGHLAVGALVNKADAHLAGDKSHLAEALHQGVEFEVDAFVAEDFPVVFEGGPGAGFTRFGLADHFHRPQGDAALVALAVDLAVLANFHLAPFGQRVDRRSTHAVQAAGYLIAGVAELTAGVQHGHDHFQRGLFLLRVDVHRDAAAVVLHGHRGVGVDGDLNLVARPGHGLVDRVVDDFVDQVVQRFDIGATDVHARAAAYRFQTLQNLDVFGAV